MRLFKNREALSPAYIPSRLPHRELELKKISHYFNPVFSENVNVKVHIYGKIGTGKTVLCNMLGRNLEREAKEKGVKLKYVYINLAYTPKPYHVMLELMELVLGSSTTGLSPEQMLGKIAKTIINKDVKIVVALDEVDTYIKEGRDQKIFYILTRVHEFYSSAAGRISLIYISRNWIG